MKSYLKFLGRNKLYTAIEAIGLSVSIAFIILTGSYVWQQYSITKENPDRENIYIAGMPDYPGLTYAFPGVAASRIPEIETISGYCPGFTATATYGEDSFNVSGVATGPEFFDIFPYYGFVSGSPEGLKGKDNIFVSETFASRLGEGDMTGKSLTINGNTYVIAGILKDFRNTLIPYADLVAPLESQLNIDAREYPYDRYGSTVPFIKVKAGTDRKVLSDKINELCKEIYPTAYGGVFLEYVALTRLDEIFFSNMQNFNSGDASRLRLLSAICLLLLVSAIFNYINLSLALAGKRAKEMATRRLHGASGREIFGKYITESVLFTALCTVIAVMIAVWLTPVMNSLIQSDVAFEISFSPGLIAALVALILLIGTLSGIIPASFASRFKPIDIVKGKFRASSKMIFSKVFIIFQGALAVFLISMAIVMEAQYSKSLHRPMNADTGNKYYLRVNSYLGSDGLISFMDRLNALPCVRRTGLTRGVPGVITGGQYAKTTDGKDLLLRTYSMDSTAFNMLGFKILDNVNAPVYSSVWFGEKARMASGIGRNGEGYELTELSRRMNGAEQFAGTIADFPVNSSNYGEEDYLCIPIVATENMGFAGWLIETVSESREVKEQICSAYQSWSKERFGIVKEESVSAFISQIFVDGLSQAKRQMRLIEIFMLIAVLISLLGLIAMSTYYAEQNSKDIAVRKVFGGTVGSETAYSVEKYLRMIAVSCIIGIPAAVWAAQRYLQEYIYRIEGYWWIFLVAVVLALAISAASVLWQTLRAARTNPATELKKD